MGAPSSFAAAPGQKRGKVPFCGVTGVSRDGPSPYIGAAFLETLDLKRGKGSFETMTCASSALDMEQTKKPACPVPKRAGNHRKWLY